VHRAVFPPEEVAQVKAIACELPKTHGLALSRFSRSELHRFVVEQAVSQASASTIGRWLAEDASSRGSIDRGSSRATRTSSSAPARSWISMRVAGRAGCWSPATA